VMTNAAINTARVFWLPVGFVVLVLILVWTPISLLPAWARSVWYQWRMEIGSYVDHVIFAYREMTGDNDRPLKASSELEDE